MIAEQLKAPFPYFGGKSSIAVEIWKRFGDVRNYVEPFFGSGAVLLNRPLPFDGPETVNDKDGFVSNFWRALSRDPEQVALHADWPVNENDLHARHSWLVGQKDSMQTRLDGDPDFYDCKVAGWWCWGMCCWIGSGFCSGNGPWHVAEDAAGVRQLVHLGDAGQGINRQLVHLGDAGQGINRQLVHLGDAGRGVNKASTASLCTSVMPGADAESATPVKASTASESGVERKRVSLANEGRGVNRKRPIVTNDAVGIVGKSESIYEWMRLLSERMKRVRVCSGDWSRVCGPTPTVKQGLTAVFLDPPYADTAGRQSDLYRVDSDSVAHAVREWAIANGGDKRIRIALCGYENEHQMPDDWTVLEWKARGGYGSQGDEDSSGRENSKRERIWFSPHCVKVDKEIQRDLFQ